METVDRKGQRLPHSYVWCTANRELYAKWKRLNEKLSVLDPASDEYKTTKAKADGIDFGGRFIAMKKAVMTGTAGKVATKAAIKESEIKNTPIRDPRSWLNRTRNVEDVNSGEKRKFHIDLLIEFDRTTVIH